jgi:flagellar biogenesis protein FliO
MTQEDRLSPILLNFALEYAIRKFQANQVEELNGTHQLLITEARTVASKENV